MTFPKPQSIAYSLMEKTEGTHGTASPFCSSQWPFLCPCEVVFSFPKQSRPSGWSLRARLSVCEAISTTRLLRAFGPRNDRGKSLRGRSIVSEAVSFFIPGGHCEPRYSSPICHCEPRSLAWRSSLVRLLRFARSDKKGGCFVASLLAVTKKKLSQ